MQDLRIRALAACLAVTTLATVAEAADFPKRPLRLLASGVGGTGDFTARLIGPHLTSRLGPPVIVDNRPGGVIPGETGVDVVAKTPQEFGQMIRSEMQIKGKIIKAAGIQMD